VSTPKEQWQITDALVFSAEWVTPSRNDWGHYMVVYSYRVGEDRYTGDYNHYCKETESYLHSDDRVSIRYCPEHPAKSYYPDAKKRISKLMLVLSFDAGIALIVLLIIYLTGGFR
jgi:hypothetical protein